MLKSPHKISELYEKINGAKLDEWLWLTFGWSLKL